MKNSSIETIIAQIYIDSLVYGSSREINVKTLEPDGRKQNKILRDLRQRSLIAQIKLDSASYEATVYAYQYLLPEEPNFVKIWDNSRKGWNHNKNLQYVRFNYLKPEEKKWVIKNKSELAFSLCYNNVLDYQHQIQENDLVSVLFENLIEKRKELETLKKTSGKTWFPIFEILVSNSSLKQHCQNVMVNENLDRLYERNLKWGLVTLGVIEEGSDIPSDDNPFSGYRNFSNDPEKWNEESVDKRIDSLELFIKQKEDNLSVLKKIKQKIAELGGWEIFKNEYRLKLKASVEKEIGSSVIYNG